jgi:hypothetical protein
VRDERAKLLRAIRVMKRDDVPLYAVAGQYGPAKVGGQDIPGFRQEEGVDPQAQTDTYAAATFFIDGGGPASLSTSGAANAFPNVLPISLFNSTRRRWPCFNRRHGLALALRAPI